MNEKDVGDFDWALGLNRLSLRLIGVWPDDTEEESLSTFLRVPFMILSMFVFLFLPQMYALTLVINELPLVVDNIMTSNAAFASCVKLYFVWRSKKVLRPVVQSAVIDWQRPKRKWEFKVMKRQALRARMFTISGYVILAGCYAGFVCAPFFGINIRMISNITDYGDRYLLVQSYFPYDYSRSPNYELTHLSQLMAGIFTGMSLSIPNNYFGALVLHTSAQFEILGTDIENFIQKDDVLHGSKCTDFDRRLEIFIKRHIHLTQMITAIENSFCFVIMSQILSMSVMVCCLGFQILGLFGNSGHKTSFLQLLTLLSTLFTWMMHALVDCFASEILALSSADIFHKVYNSKWYEVPQQYTKDLIPMMILSKTPKKLTAGKIFRLSLSTYCKIMKSTAGYISMLIAVSKR